MTLASGFYIHEHTHRYTYTMERGRKGTGRDGERKDTRVEGSKLCRYWQLNSIKYIFGKKVRPQTHIPP